MLNAENFGKRFYQWLSQFGAVYRGVLPSGEKTAKKYLQFSGYYDGFSKHFILPINIYTLNSTSYDEVLNIARNIENTVTEAGVLVIYEDVRFKIEKGSPFYQDKADENPTIRAGYINLEISIY